MSSTIPSAAVGYRPTATQIALALVLVLASVAVGAAAHRIYQLSELKPIPARASAMAPCRIALGQTLAFGMESLTVGERRLCGITAPSDTAP